MGSPESPHASFLPICGPITLYPMTSRIVAMCMAVRGCSNMHVFIAGNTYVGVFGVSALSKEV
jgi:hypothetical protein